MLLVASVQRRVQTVHLSPQEAADGVALVAGARDARVARRLIRVVLSKRVEQMLQIDRFLRENASLSPTSRNSSCSSAVTFFSTTRYICFT